MKWITKIKILFAVIYTMVYLWVWGKFNSWLWKSKRGAALFHAIFNEYTNNIMFKERAKYFGKVEATKMFSHSEFKLFLHKLIQDDWFYTKLLFCPGKIIEELGEKDMYLKKLVKFT